MKLYYARGACSLAVHIVLLETNRRCELERVDLKTHRTASGADYYQINPKGYVPALVLNGGTMLTEAGAILQYLADLEPDSGLAPPWGTFARYRLQEWLFFLSSELHKAFGPLFRPDTPDHIASRARGRIGERLAFIQNDFADRGYLMGETFTIADAYLYVLLTWCPKFGIDLALWPNLQDYEERISQRASVIEALAQEGLPIPHHYDQLPHVSVSHAHL